MMNTATAARPAPAGRWVIRGYRIRMSTGRCITNRYVNPEKSNPESDGEPHVFLTRREASKFIRDRKGECKQQRTLCLFDVHKYRLEPLYAPRR